MSINRRKFLHLSGALSLGIGIGPSLFDLSGYHLLDAPQFNTWASPEKAGISSEVLLKFLQAADQSGLEFHSFLMLRYGKIVAEAYWKPFEKNHIHTLYSLSKSFTSTAIGLAVKEGLLKETDKIVDFFPGDLPAEPSENLKKMEVRHLLSMSTGHGIDTIPKMRESEKESWIRIFLSMPVEYEPGTHFLYNTGATYMLGAVLYKVTGKTLFDYLTPRLFQPLGITQADWEISPEGLNTGGYGLRITTQDIAKLGQLYLQKGQWEGKEMLPEAWVTNATSSHIKSYDGQGDWSQGYCYQFWRCRHDCYRGDGAFGQYCIVMPAQKTIIAITSESKDMQAGMNLIWEHLLPEFKDASLDKNGDAHKQLHHFIAGLQLPVEQGSATAPTQEKLANKTFAFAENAHGVTSCSFDFTKTGGVLAIKGNNIDVAFPFGFGHWIKSKERLFNPFVIDYRSRVPSQVAGTAAWDGDVLKIRIKYAEAIHGDLLTIRFNNNDLEMGLLSSLAEKGLNGIKETRAALKASIV